MAPYRRAERHPLRFKLTYDDGRSYNVGLVEDISASGMLLEAPEPLPLGAEVRLEPFDAREDALFELRARVVRCFHMERLVEPPDPEPPSFGQYGLGLEFVGLDPHSQRALERMIEQLEGQAAAGSKADPFLGR